MTKKSANKMWGGRFEQQQSQIMLEINQSISFDKALYKQDIQGSMAHAKMLAKVKILTKEEEQKINKGLKQILAEIESGKFQFKKELEDIHMNIESRLAEIIGDTAGKLHTARSRNDQVATDFKLFVRDEIDEIKSLLLELQKIILKRAEENIDSIMPGFTHLQVAQPVSFAHHLLAYFEMFKRDISRLEDVKKRLNQSPLGSCALAGTSFPIDRFFTAKELGFDQPCANSMDGVSDRDFVIEFLSALSIISVHLSRISEEIVIWMSKGFKFISLSDAYTSGSSIMPQKKNPDAAELIRAKSGRIFGSLTAILTITKGLTLTYSKDLQEDKEPVFDAAKNIKLTILAMSGMILDMKVNKENMAKMAGSDYSTATDIADWLVRNLKIPFRKAHHITGSIVAAAEKKGIELQNFDLKEMQKIEKDITKDIFNFLSAQNSANSRNSFGGTASSEVKKALKNATDYLKNIK